MTLTDNVYALELHDVVKRFGDKTAVAGLTLSVEPGIVLALLGPNGAGKTTTIEMCEGFASPTSGRISVFGIDPARNPDAVRSQVGIMLQDSGSYSGIKVRELLELTARYSTDPLDIDWLLKLVGLENAQSVTYRRLSGGQKQRLNLAVALISRPRLVFLDEPTAGMDTQSKFMMWDLVHALKADGVTVVLTTHLMEEAEALADRIVILDAGAIVAEGTLEQLRNCSSPHISFHTNRELDVYSFPGPEIIAVKPGMYRIAASPTPELVEKLAAFASSQSVLITQLDTHMQSLENIFLDITGRSLRS
ncbi:MAG: ABC transporter ATP-binding protein [Corynebacterium sp.]|uniref:ABC transporter ATP-binding protein n=1 Tax=Corynebacterium sp. TaxID=1720 RepID=UPI0026DC1DAF|nr:ABC transporter ATP-binding protein [Corynebacterium sp.]MDO5097750.1 ABC transporter ATP-binding protein [Corynebacterium sp.]